MRIRSGKIALHKAAKWIAILVLVLIVFSLMRSEGDDRRPSIQRRLQEQKQRRPSSSTAEQSSAAPSSESTRSDPFRFRTEWLSDPRFSVAIALYEQLRSSETRYFSQNGEDGVLHALAHMFNTTSASSALGQRQRFFVEIGAGNGIQCNTRYLREVLGWDGLLFDARMQLAARRLHNETIVPDNVVSVLRRYNVSASRRLDLLSEDTDYADYWIVEQLLLGAYRPRLLVHEVNQQPADRCVTVQRPRALTVWVESEYHGGSVCAFYCLARRHGYTMVYCERAGVNCFWVRNDLVAAHVRGTDLDFLQRVLNPRKLWVQPRFDYSRDHNRVWHHIDLDACLRLNVSSMQQERYSTDSEHDDDQDDRRESAQKQG